MTNDTIAAEVRLMSLDLLTFIHASSHRKWRGWKHAVRLELRRREG